MIELVGVNKIYDLGDIKITVLHNIDLKIDKGEFITIMGPSGSGKSTLLHILGLIDQATTGIYRIEGHEINNLSDKEHARIRNQHFGFIFQSFNLIPEFNSLENVMMPLIYAKINPKERKERAIELLKQVKLEHRIYHYPNMLSGGEQQRVAIARALANDPTLILADEPTGNLPSIIGMEILNILYELNKQNVTIVMVTHDEKIATCGKRIIHLKDGKIISDKNNFNQLNPHDVLEESCLVNND